MWPPCLPAALCLVALLGGCPGLSRGEVVGKGDAGFGACDAFFYDRTPPEGFDPLEVAKICQKYQGEPRFATLYSTRDKIPLYSAFRYREMAQSCPEEARWLVEPQIDDPENGLAGMMPEADVTGSVNNLGANQALAADYKDSGYERGQLNPSSLHKDDHQRATYTLTNAFPVMPPLQDVWHWEIENLVGRGLAPHCGNGKDLYLISGAVPSSLRVKDKIAVPESLWLAACCDNGAQAWSVGFIKQAAAGSRLEELSLEELEKKLSAGTQLFKNNCGQDKSDPKKLEAILQSVKEIKAEEPVLQARKSSPSHQTGTEMDVIGCLKRLFFFIFTPIFRLLKFVLYTIGQIVKCIFHLLWCLIQMVIQGVSNFIKGILSALKNIFIDLIRVILNILNGLAKNIYNVLMIAYKILSVPVHLLLDIVSFPFYVLGAVPALLQDIASGVGGLFMLVINAITSIVKGLNYVISHLAKKIIPNLSSYA